MLLNVVRFGPVLLAIMLCGALVSFFMCPDGRLQSIVTILALCAVSVAIGLALVNMHSAVTYTPKELAERMQIATTRPATHVAIFYCAGALGAIIGSRPPEQLSRRMRLISFALLAAISLSADVILFTRSGDVRFLMGQACFNAPMAVAYWLSDSLAGLRLRQAQGS